MFHRTRAIRRAPNWISEPDTRPHAQPPTYRMTCDLCGATSHTSVEFGTVHDWQRHHATRHTHHHTYTQTVTRPWQARIGVHSEAPGLADALRSDSDRFAALHDCFLDRLPPLCAQLLDAAGEAGGIRPGVQPYELMRGIGNLCGGRDDDPRYDPRRLIALLQGLRQPHAS